MKCNFEDVENNDIIIWVYDRRLPNQEYCAYSICLVTNINKITNDNQRELVVDNIKSTGPLDRSYYLYKHHRDNDDMLVFEIIKNSDPRYQVFKHPDSNIKQLIHHEFPEYFI